MPSYVQRKVSQVNSIIRFIEDPCSAPWSVYVKCALPPLGTLTLGLLAFGLDDIIRGYFRPAGIYSPTRTGRRRARGRMARAARAGIPELGEIIGHRLPGAQLVAKRGVSAGVAALWLLDGVLQRIMFWWMLLDLLSDALYQWSTLVAQTQQCQLDRLVGSVACQVQPSGYVHDLRGPLACSAIEKWWGRIDQHGGVITHYEPVGITAAAVTVAAWIDEPWRILTGVTVWIADPADPYIPLSPPAEGVLQLNGTYNCVVDADVAGPRNTRAYIMPHGRNVFVTGGILHGWAYKQ